MGLVEGILFIILICCFPVVLSIFSKDKPKNNKISVPVKETDLTLKEFRVFKKLYLTTKEWLEKREVVKRRDGYQCQKCESPNHLHVHHMWGYDEIPYETTDCLITLCKDCHLEEHKKVGFPKTINEYYSFYHPIPRLKRKQYNTFKVSAIKAKRKTEEQKILEL